MEIIHSKQGGGKLKPKILLPKQRYLYRPARLDCRRAIFFTKTVVPSNVPRGEHNGDALRNFVI